MSLNFKAVLKAKTAAAALLGFLAHIGILDVKLSSIVAAMLIKVRRVSICNVQNVEAGCMQRSITILSAPLMPGNAPAAENWWIQL